MNATRFDRLEQHIERLLDRGRVFLTTGWELSGVTEMARDVEVDVEVKWTDRGWWIVLQ